jgi:aminomethyltransferase
LNETTNPVDAALMWAIPKSVRSGGKFQGAAALEKAITAGPTRKRVGIKAEGRMPVRDHTPISDEAGNEIGLVTSGGFGPTVGHPVAMGYVTKSALDAGTTLFATVRGNQIPLSVSPLPFTPHNYVKG